MGHPLSGKQGAGPKSLFLDDINEAGVPAQTSIFVPRHQLAVELREVIERAFQERDEPISGANPPRSGEWGRGGESALPEVAPRPESWRGKGCQSTPISASGSRMADGPVPLFYGVRVHPDPERPPIARHS